MAKICFLGASGQLICFDPTSHPRPGNGSTTSTTSNGPTSSGSTSVGSKPTGKSGQLKDLPDYTTQKSGPYRELVADVNILDNIHQATKSVADADTREALQSGVKSALDALWKRASKDVSYIELSD